LILFLLELNDIGMALIVGIDLTCFIGFIFSKDTSVAVRSLFFVKKIQFKKAIF
jgi:hypothetical protein